VGVNIRGRDVESLIHEIQQKLDNNLQLPPGYYITYGGEFENLERAQKRLGIVVPIALALIFILLYFALNSFKQSAMIYMAIPLAAIGGVFSLYFRGLPFSISAGVGFIVLFGVAVLNGLVLINRLNELKVQGVIDLKERIYKGTKQRLRPILLTAIAAIMGFTPMALSTSAGAEVQRPLATVVIGGLITATLLTLIVIPVLYYLIERGSQKKDKGNRLLSQTISVLILFVFMSGFSFLPETTFARQAASSDTLVVPSLKQAEAIALQNNPAAQASKLKITQRRQLQKTAVDIPKTSVYYGKEEAGNNVPGIQSIGINQVFEFPTVYGKRSALLKEQTQLAKNVQQLTQSQLTRQVRLSWYHLQNAYLRLKVYTRLDSFYSRFYEAAALRYKTGETNKLEVTAAKAQQAEIGLQKEQSTANIKVYLHQLEGLLNAGQPVSIPKIENAKAKLLFAMADTSQLKETPLLQYYKQQIAVAKSQTGLEKARLLPSLNAGFALQQVDGQAGYHSFQVGIGIPLWFRPQQGRIQAAKAETAINRKQFQQQKLEVTTRFKQLMEQYKQAASFLNYYESQGLQLADEILRNSDMAFRQGEIGYVEYIQNINRTISLYEGYLSYLNQYNEVVTEINYLLNN
jgi:cobalt-zinc-cadmium resistance protein CzcA